MGILTEISLWCDVFFFFFFEAIPTLVAISLLNLCQIAWLDPSLHLFFHSWSWRDPKACDDGFAAPGRNGAPCGEAA